MKLKFAMLKYLKIEEDDEEDLLEDVLDSLKIPYVNERKRTIRILN